MRLSWMVGAGFLLAALVPIANAQPTYSVDYGFNYSAPTLDINYMGVTEDCYAGPFSATWPAGTTPPIFAPTSPFSVYCIDITHNISPPANPTVTASQVGQGFSTTPSNPFVSVAQLQEASYLIDKYGSLVGVDSTYSGGIAGTTQAELDSGAALQVAIWDVIGGDNILSAHNDITNPNQNFWISNPSDGNIIGQADGFLDNLGAAINGGGGGGNGVLLEIYPASRREDNSGQNMLGGSGPIAGGGGGYSVTPEGSSLYLFAFGLAPLLGLRWFARRRVIS